MKSLAWLAAFLAFQALLLGSWIARDTAPPGWDQSIQLETAIDIRDLIAAGDWGGIARMRPKPGMPPFPPLYHLTIQGFLGADDPAHAALWINWFYLALLAVSIWGLGRHFCGEWRGLAAAVLFCGVPEVQWLMRENLLDLALTAWVAAAYWALVLSDGFRNRRVSAAFGLLVGAAMMTKWSAFSYFLPAVWIAAKALKDPKARFGVAAALALAFAAAAPWYLPQWPVVLPRLVTASADRAVPIWRGGAVFNYFWQMLGGFDPPFFLIGLVSLAVPSVTRKKEGSWMLLAWLATSWLFWTIVPNRQLRYLLPGLAPFAIFAVGPWPRSVLIGLCAFQLASAANFGYGVIPIPMLRTGPAAEEDWKIGEILEAAGSLHRGPAGFGNLSLVANHPRFNGPNFRWERKRRRVESLRIRGVNRRLCEFSEFVVVKTGSLGPAAVVNQLPEVQALMLDKDFWFQRGWAEARRWPLPDGSEAVLFQRRIWDRPLFEDAEVVIGRYEEQSFRAEGLRLQFSKWDPAAGAYPSVRLRAPKVVLRGLEIRNVDIEMEGVSFVTVEDPAKADKTAGPAGLLSDLRFLGMDRLVFHSAEIDEAGAAAFLQERAGRAVSDVRFRLDGTISARLSHNGRAVSAEVAVDPLPRGSGVAVALKNASYAGIPVPVGLLGPLSSFERSFEPDSELPFRISVSGLRIAGGRLVIGK